MEVKEFMFSLETDLCIFEDRKEWINKTVI